LLLFPYIHDTKNIDFLQIQRITSPSIPLPRPDDDNLSPNLSPRLGLARQARHGKGAILLKLRENIEG